MKLTQNYRKIKLSTSFFILIFTFFSVLWIYTFNSYHVLSFQEETQLFRTDYFYFHEHISKPAGLMNYIGSFLTQFYINFLVGALILSLAIVLVYLLAMLVNKRSGVKSWLLLLTSVIPVLLLMASADVNIRLSNILSLSFVLGLFLVYQNVGKQYRYVIGCIAYVIAYFVCGGNAMLLICLIIINELFSGQRSLGYMAALLLLAVAVPYLSHLFIYTTTLENSYLALTPYELTVKNNFYTAVWLYIPILYLIWRWVTRKIEIKEEKAVWKKLITFYILIAGLTTWGVIKITDTNREVVSRMAYEVERGNWDEVIALGKKYTSPENAVLVSYFLNIAHSEKGLMASNMFDYRQTGSLGLFLSWSRHYDLLFYTGELYYRMGIIPEGEHCAFESLVICPNEYGSKPLRRLVYTNMLRQDSLGFEKYIRFFDKSPVYAKWADRQREAYRLYSAGDFKGIENAPKPEVFNDFYINYDQPEYNLIVMLRTNTGNRKVFEYLIASIMLQKQLATFLTAMDKYYKDMGYTQLPKHLEEALIVCRYNLKGKEDTFNKYPVSKETLERFIQYAEESQKATTEPALRHLQAKYGNTFWYYYQYVNPMTLEKAKLENRY